MLDEVIDRGIEARGVTAKDGTAKARIERAALNLFIKTSIEGVSTKSLSTLAGVSEGLLYRHFKSKDDLARTLMFEIHTRLTDLVRGHTDQSLDAAIGDIVRDYARLADEDWALFAYHLLYMHRFAGIDDDSPLKAATDLVSFNQSAGRLPNGLAPHVLASMALGVVLQTAQSKVAGVIDQPLSDFIPYWERAVMAVLEDA